MLPPLPLADPDVQISRFRFFTGELCSRRCNGGRSGLLAEGDARGERRIESNSICFPAATTISARSFGPDGSTSLVDERCQLCRSRRSGPAS
jgi:hypothetical protein